jgi:hypothetical protein
MPDDPLSLLSDQQLFDTQLTIALGCGRAKAAVKGKHRANLCFLFVALAAEADKRGKPTPQAPYVA